MHSIRGWLVSCSYPKILFLIGVFVVCGWGGGEAYAQTAGSAGDQAVTQWINFFNIILNLIYVFIWPLLFITGYSMDNSMVYGSFIGLDAPLWKFRNLTKNFANFALGFLVLREILKYVFSFGTGGLDSNPQKVITNTMIAGVGIQVSWFVLAALIDLSTILTATVGGLPLTILQTSNTTIANRPILMTHGTIDLNSSDPFNPQKNTMYYSFGNKYFAPCEVRGGYIVGPMNVTGTVPPAIKTAIDKISDQYCVMQGYVVKYQKKLNSKDCKSNPILTGDALTSACLAWPRDAANRVIQTSSDNLFLNEEGKVLADITDSSQGMVGPLVTLYSTLLNFGSITQAGGGGTLGGVMIEFMLKAVVGLLLMIPLIALCGVMLWRILNLWLVIALTPLYALEYVFGLKWLSSLPAIGDPKELISMIFAPVLPVLAISLSVVFLTVIQTTMQPGIDTRGSDKNFLKAIGIQALSTGEIEKQGLGDWRKTECRDYVLTKMCFDKAESSIGDSVFLNFVNWLVLNIIAIGLMRAIVFAALGSLTFAKSIVDTIKGAGESFLGGIPIIPLPGTGGQKVGLGALADGSIGRKINEGLGQRFNKPTQEALNQRDPFLNGTKPSNQSAVKYATGNDINTAIGAINETGKKYGDALGKSLANMMANKDNAKAIEEYITKYMSKDPKAKDKEARDALLANETIKGNAGITELITKNVKPS